MVSPQTFGHQLKRNPIYKRYKELACKNFNQTLHRLDKTNNWWQLAKTVKIDDIREIFDYLDPMARNGQYYCAYSLTFISYRVIRTLNDNNQHDKLTMHLALKLGWLCLKLRLSKRAISPLKLMHRIMSHFESFYENRLEGLKLLANAYRNVGKYNLAIEKYTEGVAIAQQYNNIEYEAILLFMLGKIYCNYLNQIPRGIDYLNQALELFKDIDNKLFQAICLDELGAAYLSMLGIFKNFPIEYNKLIKKIEDYHHRSIRLAEEINFPPTKSRNLAHLGELYMKLGRIDEAFYIVKKSKNIIKNCSSERRGLGIRLGQLGELYVLKNNLTTAIKLLKTALKINREFNDSKNVCKNSIRLSMAYKKLKKCKMAEDNLKTAIRTARRYKFLEIEKQANYELGLIHAENFQYQKAITHFRRAGKLLEHILDRLIKESMEFKAISPQENLESMYRGLMEKYHIESITNYKQSNEIFQRAFYQLKNTQQKEKEHHETIMKVAMRTAHKMYSPLNRIMNRMESRLDDKIKVMHSLLKMSKIYDSLEQDATIHEGEITKLKITFNNIQNWLENEFRNESLLKEDIETVFDMVDQMKNQNNEKGYIPRLYLDEKVNLNQIVYSMFQGEKSPDSIEVQFKLDEQLPKIPGNKYKFRQIIEPIRENAIQHSNGSQITVVTKRLNHEYVSLKISDNGKGIPPDEKLNIFEAGYSKTEYTSSHQGLGLHIVRTLADAYHAKVKCRSKSGKGTIFSIIFPTQKEGNS